MQSEAEFANWVRLFDTFDTSPERYPVGTWTFRMPDLPPQYGAMDIWPILKTQIMLRACNLFHAGATRVLIPQKQIGLPESRFVSAAGQAVPLRSRPRGLRDRMVGFAKSVLLGDARRHAVGELARSWPDYASDVLCFGSRINNYRIGPNKVQIHLDALRLALDDNGYRSATLLLDLRSSDGDEVDQALLGGTYAFQDQFNAARQARNSPGLIDFSAMPGFDSWYEEIAAVYPIETLSTRKLVSDVIRQTYSTYTVFKDYFVLRKIKAVFLYAFYGIAGHAAAMACRELGIPLFDVQHGVAGRGHESYHWPACPARGYNTLPTHFLFWADEECRAIEQHSGTQGPEAIRIGHSWRLIDQVMRSEDNYLLANDDRLRDFRAAYQALGRSAAETMASMTATRHILVTLYSEEDIGWMRPLFEAAPDNWQFHIRLHPGELGKAGALDGRRQSLDYNNVRFDLANGLPMPLLLPNMDLHVTKYSSSVLDAAAFGIASVCYSLSAKWFYDPARYHFVTVVAHDAEALRHAIEAAFSADAGQPRKERVEMPALGQSELGHLLKQRIGSG